MRTLAKNAEKSLWVYQPVNIQAAANCSQAESFKRPAANYKLESGMDRFAEAAE